MLQLLPSAISRICSAATHVAVGLEPSDWAVEALPVVLVGLGELGSQTGELELVSIDLLAATDQLRGYRLAGSRRSFPGHNLRVESLRTTVWWVKKIGCYFRESRISIHHSRSSPGASNGGGTERKGRPHPPEAEPPSL